MRQFEENISLRKEDWELRYLVVEVSLFQYERESNGVLSKLKNLERVGK